MDALITILTIIDVVIALLLVALILVQPSKDGGFGGAPFGGAGEAIFGGHAADHLSKFTVVLTTLFFVITLTLAIVTGRRPGGELSVAETSDAPAELSVPAGTETPKVEDDANEKTLEILAGDEDLSDPVPSPAASEPVAEIEVGGDIPDSVEEKAEE